MFLLTGAIFASCAGYKQNILFQVSPDQVRKQTREAQANYTIQQNDLLTLEVYTNQGEKIVDPNRESFKEGDNQQAGDDTRDRYLVDVTGQVKLPLLGEMTLEGLTIRQGEALLQQAYEKYYEQAFVRLEFANKRVIVLGAPGGQVIPLSRENMRLTEILALAKGMPSDAKAHNIRILRDNDVLVADLSTFSGYQEYNYLMHPGDIVYVEPVRRPLIEALRDYAPLIGIITNVTTLIFIIIQVNQ